jgi:hypothetical protein
VKVRECLIAEDFWGVGWTAGNEDVESGTRSLKYVCGMVGTAWRGSDCPRRSCAYLCNVALAAGPALSAYIQVSDGRETLA